MEAVAFAPRPKEGGIKPHLRLGGTILGSHIIDNGPAGVIQDLNWWGDNQTDGCADLWENE